MKLKKLVSILIIAIFCLGLFGCKKEDEPTEVDAAPVIYGAEDKTIEKGTKFVPLDGITANDKEDGDLTSSIKYSGNVNVNVPGEYTATYTVYDSYGNKTEATIKVTVELNDKAAPILTGVGEVDLVVGEPFDSKEGVTANDVIDGDLTNKITVDGTVDVWTVGEYTLSYSVSDNSNNTTTITRKVNVTLGYFDFDTNVLTDAAYTNGELRQAVSSGEIDTTIAPYGLAKLTFKASSATEAELTYELGGATCAGKLKLTATATDYTVYFRFNAAIENQELVITGAQDVVMSDVELMFGRAQDKEQPVITVADDYEVVLPGNVTDLDVLKPFILKGISATDNIDGNLTSKLDVDLGGITLGSLSGNKVLTVFVADKSGNRAEKKVEVTFTNVYNTNFVQNSDFSTDDVSQFGLNGGAGNPTITVENGEMVHQTTVKCDPGWDSASSPTMKATTDIFRAGNWYMLKFDARATIARNMTVRIGLSTTEAAGWIENFKGASNYPLNLTTDMQTYYVLFYVHANQSVELKSNVVSIEFKLGTFYWDQNKESMNPVYFDNLQFYLLSNDDTAPVVIEAENTKKVFGKGEELPDFTSYVIGYDYEDGGYLTITSGMVDVSAVDMNTVGKYPVVFRVNDSYGHITELTIEIEVIDQADTTAPVITMAAGVQTTVEQFSDPIDLLKAVTITDDIDGEIAVTSAMVSGTVDVTKAGTYSVKYTVTDKSGNEGTLTIEFTVTDKEAPKFVGKDTVKMTVGDKLDLLSLVSVTDNVDGKMTLTVDNFAGYTEFLNSKFKAIAIGQFEVTVTVKDAADNEGQYKITVKVEEMADEIVLEDELKYSMLTAQQPIDAGSASCASVTYTADLATISVSDVGGWASYAKMKIKLEGLTMGETYKIKMVLKADQARRLEVCPGQSLNNDPWYDKFTIVEGNSQFVISDEFALYEIYFAYDKEYQQNGPYMEFRFGNTWYSGDVAGNNIYIKQFEIYSLKTQKQDKVVMNVLDLEPAVDATCASNASVVYGETQATVAVTNVGTSPLAALIRVPLTSLVFGNSYTLRFTMKADSARTVMMNCGQALASAPYMEYFTTEDNYTVNITNEFATYEITFVYNVADKEGGPTLAFCFGNCGNAGDVAGNNLYISQMVIIDNGKPGITPTISLSEAAIAALDDAVVYQGQDITAMFAYLKGQITIQNGEDTVEVTDDMIDLDGLSLTNPIEGTYNVKVSYTNSDEKSCELVIPVVVDVEDEVLFENFESYADTAALQASGWHKRYNGNNTTNDLELVVDGENKAAKFTFTNDASTPHHFRKNIVGSDYSTKYVYIKFQVLTTAEKIQLWAYTATANNGKEYTIADITYDDGYCYIKISDTGYNLQDLVYIGLSFKGQSGDFAYFDNISFTKKTANPKFITHVLDDFQSYEDTAALQTSGWHKRYNGNNTTNDLELVVDGENKAAKFTFTNDANTPHHFRKNIVGSDYDASLAYIRFQVQTTATKLELWAYTTSKWNGKSFTIADITKSDGYCYIKVSDTGYKLQDLAYIAISFKGQTGDYAIFDNIEFCNYIHE